MNVTSGVCAPRALKYLGRDKRSNENFGQAALEEECMKLTNWIKAASLLVALGLGLAACTTIKPVHSFDTALTLSAPATVVRGGESFLFTATLSYQDEAGQTQPLAHQEVEMVGMEFDLHDTFMTDGNGSITLELVAPLLPEREKERDAWVRAHFDGTVIEFSDRIGRFGDASNARYFSIQQSAPGLNNPGIPGAE